MGSSTSNVQDMTSWLDRLALAEDDDDAISSAHSQRKGDDSHVSQRQKTYTYGRYNYRDHDDKPTASYSGSYAKREASVRSHSPVSSHSRSPSRSPSPRRRAVVSTHNSLRGRDRDTSRDRSVYDTYDRHSRRDRYDGHDRRDSHSDAHSRKSLPPCRSVPDRSDSHSRRRPPLKRGPSSSSSTSNNSSSSKSAWESAARNALRAGTMAALSSHSAPGSWFGNKGTRVATAALGAALVDTYMGHRHPESVNGVRHTAMRQAAEYAISSIVAEPIMQRAARRKTRR
ncbi:hypothetical protein SBRCBS47491_004341 [Sporothrix bragantina]|uniref:Uncharacterized protein n=1 Tax=Sporothrix bragantina TaxID=671064 RepID=A0ABP0BN66_9PEZI